MNKLHEILDKHLTDYPLMELQDMVKLIYQNEFGPGHMIADEAQSLKRLETEWETVIYNPFHPLSEPVGNGLARIHLAAVRRDELPVLNRMFCETAGYIAGFRADFIDKLSCLAGYFPDTDSFLSDYISKGCPPLSHSRTYR